VSNGTAVVFCAGCGTPVPTLIPAHSGAGITSLATATGFHDTAEPTAAQDHARAIRLLVARTHHAGLAAARTALDAGRHDNRYTRLVLVPDAPGQLPKPLKDQIAVIGGPTPVTVLPWVEVWRWIPGNPAESFTKAFTALSTQLITDRP